MQGPRPRRSAALQTVEFSSVNHSVGPRSVGAAIEDYGLGGSNLLASWCSNSRVWRTRVE
jgi:hypothetical protein